jgi:hypothetical protein
MTDELRIGKVLEESIHSLIGVQSQYLLRETKENLIEDIRYPN